MSPSDFIGFFISLLALAFLFFRRRREAQRRREHPELYREEEEQEDALKEFLKSMDMPVEDERPVIRVRQPEAIQPKIKKIKAQPPQPWKTNIEDRRLQSQIEQRQLQNSIDDRRLKNTIEERKLQSNIENRYADPYGVTDTGKNAPSYEIIPGVTHRSRVQGYLAKLPSKKEMVIFQEIIGPPKGLR